MTLVKPARKKSEETRARILEAALEVFRERGFESATMREIATKAEVAVGAAYYYFDSKDAIVMAFYERAQSEMGPAIEQKLAESKTLEARLRCVIDYKFDYFRPNRRLLGALSAHSDPLHPLSPFSGPTEPIREQDLLDAVNVGLGRDRVRRENEKGLSALRARFEALSPRERAIVIRVVEGRLNKQIAYEMGITESTVKVHRSNIMRKVDAASVPELCRMVDKLKLLPENSKPS